YGFISLLAIVIIHLFLFLYIRSKTKQISKVISKPVQEIAHISELLFDENKLELEQSSILEFDILQGNLHKAHEKLQEQLYFDIQTYLPNLNKLYNDINENSILILVCVENYKMIQNIYGPKVSLNVLTEITKMLKIFPRSSIQLYRIYNDTFALHCDSKTYLQDELKYLYNKLSLAHIHLDEFDISLNYALSLSLPSENSDLPLFSRADIALDEAKKQEHRKYLSFDENSNDKKRFKEHQEWAKRFQSALHENRLVPFFQPIYNIKDKKVHKFESLVRMIEGDNVISPYFFLGVAKQMGKLSDITLLMLRHVFDLAQTYTDVEFSVNTSFEDFEEAGLLTDIQKLIAEFGINTQNIIIEILETGKYKDEKHVIKTIHELKAMGFKIAIDDFGAGNSNFAHLMLMQVDFIKIDGQFVKNICDDEQSQNITKTINAFAHMTGALSIAEFVADEEIYKKIEALGIDFAQGYHISEPKPASQIDAMLKL
ncbi:MAG TPA: GGDEF domain-containing protein, partial [Sulfurimonas sp.]|nr:GGDEF domain-containing protein [Sulfurimonas sp.]